MRATYSNLGFAKVEGRRQRRQGFPEAIYCPGKTPDQIVRIFGDLLRGSGPVIATRVTEPTARTLMHRYRGSNHHPEARMVVAKPLPRRGRTVLVITAGTADLPVAEEAARTAETLGRPVKRLWDVGVAGMHRLIEHRAMLEKAAVAIVCAGMEGALASVVGGLAGCPVVAVPTSVGYGAHFQGIAPLLTMLNSCAANVSVVNIDNGFGAGVVASLIAR
ncbi:MAG TPA: nickel pincer cofactor biosynthesis protein LarB [Elusimicrobiota bacterium]|nr:nickel pincer cofactor biosynthesis protein LarB [Elusimicrobiota bacterium]